MSKPTHSKTYYWLPAIGWAIAIYIFSTHAFASGNTSRFIIPLLKWLMPNATAAELFAAHGVIRKVAHFVEYFILSVLVFRALRGAATGWRFAWSFWTLALVVGYAALDEVHQMFVPTRGASPYDVMIDSAGALTAQVFLLLLHRYVLRREPC